MATKDKNCYCLIDRRARRFSPIVCKASAELARKSGMAAFRRDKRAKEVVFGPECHDFERTGRPATTNTPSRRRRRRRRR